MCKLMPASSGRIDSPNRMNQIGHLNLESCISFIDASDSLFYSVFTRVLSPDNNGTKAGSVQLFSIPLVPFQCHKQSSNRLMVVPPLGRSAGPLSTDIRLSSLPYCSSLRPTPYGAVRNPSPLQGLDLMGDSLPDQQSHNIGFGVHFTGDLTFV